MHLFQPSSHRRKKHFDIQQVVGEGAYGKVKLARWNTHHPPIDVALKIVPKNVVAASHDEFAQRIDRLINWRHEHVVKCFEFFESRSRYYIVLEYASKGEMFDRIVSVGHYSEEDGRKALKALLEAVKFIHSQNVLHRDLKPENILYRSDKVDDFVVADFGLARELRHQDDLITNVAGSPGYTAPEVFRMKGYGFKADMWSVGVIAFVLLSGRFPFRASEPSELVRETLQANIVFPDIYWHDVSKTAIDFVRSLLNPNPAERLSAEEALNHQWFQQERCPMTKNKGVCCDLKKQPTVSKGHNPETLERVRTMISMHVSEPIQEEDEQSSNDINFFGVSFAKCRRAVTTTGTGTHTSTTTPTTPSTEHYFSTPNSGSRESSGYFTKQSTSSSQSSGGADRSSDRERHHDNAMKRLSQQLYHNSIDYPHRDITGEDTDSSPPASRVNTRRTVS